MFCVVTIKPTEQGRFYRLPTQRDLDTVRRAREELERRKREWTGELSLVPDEPTPMGGGKGAGRAFSQRNYGMEKFDDLFTSRQLLALTTLVRLIENVGNRIEAQYEKEQASAILTCIGLSLGKLSDLANSLCAWEPMAECPRHLFARQAIPIVWDFGEGRIIGESSGSWSVLIDRFAYILSEIGGDWNSTIPIQNSAFKIGLSDDIAQSFITDPPYYDAVPYADLSDFFYVWLRRLLKNQQETLFSEPLTPKNDECILDEVKGKDKKYFEFAMGKQWRKVDEYLQHDGIGMIVFAHKSTSGWEAQLQAMVDAGWIITASWPIDTEMGSRISAMDSAALASSIHLVCRPRENPDGSIRTDDVGDWRDVLHELPIRIHEWMPRLAAEGVVGADAIFACLGPALEIYSRYSRVEKPNGEQVLLHEYLEKVWEAVAREALTVIFKDADTSGFEEDARLTAMWLWTLFANIGEMNGVAASEQDDDDTGDDDEKSTGKKSSAKSGFVLDYDTAEKSRKGSGLIRMR